MLVSYILMFWAVDTSSLGEAFNLSGSSLTTLGFATADGFVERLLAFTEAGFGLFTVTLMITFLPSMYGAFSRRESQVGLLEVRAGSPPSAAEFLLRHHWIGRLQDLDDYWFEWERCLPSWRRLTRHTQHSTSSAPRSRIDRGSRRRARCSALMASCVSSSSGGPEGICIRAGYIALRRIAYSFGISFDPDPAPNDPIAIARSEFDDVWDQLAADGVPLVADRDQAWRDFAGWRVNYDTVLLSLAQITMAPLAPWTSDRSPIDHIRPRMRFFGHRRSIRDRD